MKFTSALLATIFASSAALAAPLASRAPHGDYTFDDTNGSAIKLQYSQGTGWHHDTNQGNQVYDGVISYSQDPNAFFTFSTNGFSQFAIYSGTKNDRGGFKVSVDGNVVGTGNEFNPIDQTSAPQQIFAHYGLDGGDHTVTVSNDQVAAGEWMAFNYLIMTK